MADILTVNHRLMKTLLLHTTISFASRGVGRVKQKEMGRAHNRGEVSFRNSLRYLIYTIFIISHLVVFS